MKKLNKARVIKLIPDKIAGCGKGRKCDISLYVTPQGTTQEEFKRYSDERIKQLEEDKQAA